MFARVSQVFSTPDRVLYIISFLIFGYLSIVAVNGEEEGGQVAAFRVITN